MEFMWQHLARSFDLVLSLRQTAGEHRKHLIEGNYLFMGNKISTAR